MSFKVASGKKIDCIGCWSSLALSSTRYLATNADRTIATRLVTITMPYIESSWMRLALVGQAACADGDPMPVY